MKRAAVLAVALLAGACSNQVYSKRPLFPDQPFAAAALKPGVWTSPDPGCRFDAAAPMAAWPKCATGWLAGPDRTVWRGHGFALRLADGDPMLVQVTSERRAREVWYYALGPLRRDSDGRIIEFETWAVLCGPPPAPPFYPGEDEDSEVTQDPLPGLSVTGANCEARHPESVRRAAVASRDWDDDRLRSYWVRDGDR